MTIQRIVRRGVLVGVAVLSLGLAAPAMAQTFPVKFYGSPGQVLKQGPIVVPSYELAFFTQQQGTASGGVLTKSRLTTTLSNVPEATMRRLADEAHADLIAQLKAANVPLADANDFKMKALAAGLPYSPTNSDVTQIGRTITIGAGVASAYAAYGATEAPILTGLHAPTNSPMGAMATMGVSRKVAPIVQAQQSVAVMPLLAIDFADTDAKAGRDFMGREAANVSSRLKFSINMFSKVSLMASFNNGRASSPGIMAMGGKEIGVPTAFGTVLTGEGAVRQMSVTKVVNSSYIAEDAARGDAVVVDLPVWEGLVRQAFKDYNAAIVAEIRKAQKV